MNVKALLIQHNPQFTEWLCTILLLYSLILFAATVAYTNHTADFETGFLGMFLAYCFIVWRPLLKIKERQPSKAEGVSL